MIHLGQFSSPSLVPSQLFSQFWPNLMIGLEVMSLVEVV